MPRRLIAITASLLVAAACTRAGSAPESPKVAFFEDTTIETSSYLVTPSFQGMRLAFLQAEVAGGPDVELVPFDTGGDPATALQMANDVAADHSYVAVIAAPFWLEPPAVGTVFAGAGLPTLSLSAASTPPEARAGWFRLVPTASSAAEAMVGPLLDSIDQHAPVCFGSDPGAYQTVVLGDLVDALQDRVSLRGVGSGPDFAERIEAEGCGAVVWGGSSGGAEDLIASIDAAGLHDTAIAGSDALMTETYLSQTGSNGEGTVVVCPCAEISTTSDPAAQRFIHDYQAEFTNPPWPYSAEGFDAAGMVLRALSGSPSRSVVKSALEVAPPYEGVARTYTFGSTGELVDQSVGVFRDEGQRWVSLESSYVTPSVLTMSSCLDGFPFAYEMHGRARGFDVELGAALAKRLGVGFGWKWCEASANTPRAVDAALAPSDHSPVALSLHIAELKRSGAHGHSCPTKTRSCVIGLTRDPALARINTLTGPLGTVYRRYGSTENAYDALEHRRIGALWDVEYRTWWELERRTDLTIVRTSDGSQYSLIAEDPALQTKLDGALATLLDDGTYALLFAKFFPGTPIPPETGT